MAIRKFLLTLETECSERPCYVCSKCALKDECVDMSDTICDSLNRIGFALGNNEIIKSIEVEDFE